MKDSKHWQHLSEGGLAENKVTLAAWRMSLAMITLNLITYEV